MTDKDQPVKKQTDEEAKDDLRSDRDDSMGYSREQFTFEEESPQPEEKAPKVKSAKKPAKKSTKKPARKP